MVVESSDVAAEISPTVVFINDIEVNHMSMIYIMKYFTIVAKILCLVLGITRASLGTPSYGYVIVLITSPSMVV